MGEGDGRRGREVATAPHSTSQEAGGAPKSRRLFLRALVVLLPAIAVCWRFRDWIIGWLVAPTVPVLFLDGLPQMHFGAWNPPFRGFQAIALGALLLSSPWGFYEFSRGLVRGAGHRTGVLATAYVAVSVAGAFGSTWLARSVLAPATAVVLLWGRFHGPSLPLLWADELVQFVCSMAFTAIVAVHIPVAVGFAVAARHVDRSRLLRLGGQWLLVSAAWALWTWPHGLPPVWVTSLLVGIYYASVLVAGLLARGGY